MYAFNLQAVQQHVCASEKPLKRDTFLTRNPDLLHLRCYIRSKPEMHVCRADNHAADGRLGVNQQQSVKLYAAAYAHGRRSSTTH